MPLENSNDDKDHAKPLLVSNLKGDVTHRSPLSLLLDTDDFGDNLRNAPIVNAALYADGV